MIKALNHLQQDTAQQIFNIFQSSYAIEANLIGVEDFPPLKRTADDIMASSCQFYGFYIENNLAGVIEITAKTQVLDIDSLTVSPDFFRRGIASKLITFVLSAFPFQRAHVETAAANIPAIELYQQYGFKVYKKWLPSHGIEKVALSMVSD